MPDVTQDTQSFYVFLLSKLYVPQAEQKKDRKSLKAGASRKNDPSICTLQELENASFKMPETIKDLTQIHELMLKKIVH